MNFWDAGDATIVVIGEVSLQISWSVSCQTLPHVIVSRDSMVSRDNCFFFLFFTMPSGRIFPTHLEVKVFTIARSVSIHCAVT